MKRTTILTGLFIATSMTFFGQNTFPDNGDVGIGAKVPGNKLTVKGNLNVGADGNAQIRARHINGKNYQNADYGDLYLNYHAGKRVIIGKSDLESNLFGFGNIKFQKNGEASYIFKAIKNGNYGASNIVVDAAEGFPSRLLFREAGANKGWIDHSGNKINIRDNKSKPLFTVNTSNGRIGAGATDPKDSFQVGSDGITIHNGGHKVIGFSHAPSGNVDLNSSAYSAEVRFDPTTGNLRFGTSPNVQTHPYTRMTISNDGNIGIGTSNPDSKLTVNGKIHCKEVLVDLAIPADYVFEKYYTGVSDLKEDYNMPTLEEVEAYTKENHHLPNVPSATTIQEEGLQLKEMTNLLLQKIEELTLYTIEQEKRIKALEAQQHTAQN